MPAQGRHRCQRDAGNNASATRGDTRAQQGQSCTVPVRSAGGAGEEAMVQIQYKGDF
jgi:hypothetical protein